MASISREVARRFEVHTVLLIESWGMTLGATHGTAHAVEHVENTVKQKA